MRPHGPKFRHLSQVVSVIARIRRNSANVLKLSQLSSHLSKLFDSPSIKLITLMSSFYLFLLALIYDPACFVSATSDPLPENDIRASETEECGSLIVN